MQRAKSDSVRDRPVGRVGCREGPVGQQPDDGAHVRVDRFDMVQVRLDNSRVLTSRPLIMAASSAALRCHSSLTARPSRQQHNPSRPTHAG
jgi:hypothetical protein